MPAKKKPRSGTVLTDAQRARYGMGKLTLRLEQRTLDELARLANAAGLARGKLIESWVWEKK